MRRRLDGLDRRLLVLLAVAAVVRIAYWAIFLRDYEPISDAAQYNGIAFNLANGRGFGLDFPQLAVHPTGFRPPLFPLTLSVVYAILWPAVGIGQAVNLVLGLVVVGLTYRLVKDVAGTTAATVAAGIVAIHPNLVANDVVPLAETLGLVLLLSLGLAMRRQHHVWAGLLTGLLVLERTSAQAVVVIVVAWVAVTLGLKKAAATLALTAIVVAPWVVRNIIQLDAAVLVTSNGFNLAAKHSPEARESGHFVDPVFDPRFEQFRLDQFDEVVWDRALREYAMEEITRDPLGAIPVIRRNLLELFELKPWLNRTGEEWDGRNYTFRTATLPLFYAVTVAGLAGLWLRRRDPTVLFLGLVVGYFVALNLLIISAPRLRAPFDLLCAIGVGLLVQAVRERSEVRTS